MKWLRNLFLKEKKTVKDPVADMEKLLLLLDRAESIAAKYSGGYSEHFYSAQEFHQALKLAIENLKAGDKTELQHLAIWFAPSYDWDDFISRENGEQLANDIFEILIRLRK